MLTRSFHPFLVIITPAKAAISGDAPNMSHGRPACDVEKADEREAEHDGDQHPPAGPPQCSFQAAASGNRARV